MKTVFATETVNKSLVEFANLLVNRPPVFSALGRINRMYPIVESVFVLYPTNKRYSGERYAFASRIEKQKWAPWPIGLMRQNGRFIVMVGIAAREEELLAAHNRDKVAGLVTQVEAFRERLGARTSTYAGILPGLLTRLGLLSDPPEAKHTAMFVSDAITQCRQQLSGPHDLVIVESSGFVGRRVMHLLRDQPAVYGVDLGDEWPERVSGNQRVFVNIASVPAMSDIVARIRPGDIILNEVYPPPNRALRDRIRQSGVELRHIAGVEASAFPPFPGAYSGAIPCCAAWPAPNFRVVVNTIT